MATKTYQGKHVAPTKKVPFRRKWNRFWRTVRKNRKYQTALWLLVCVLISLVSRGIQYHQDTEKYTLMMETQKEEIVAEYEGQIENLRLAHENEVADIRADYENLTPEELLKQECEYLARMLYGYRNNSERDLRTATWCALNRVDSVGYPNSVKEVCQQKSQWMGYSDDNPVLNELYDIAMKELETWHSGYRPVLADYVYMSWSSKEIVLRDTWENTKNTRYWQAG